MQTSERKYKKLNIEMGEKRKSVKRWGKLSGKKESCDLNNK